MHSSFRPSGEKNPASAASAFSKESRAKICDPIWAWTPTRATGDPARRSRATASSAAPDASPNPNFESSCPVITYSWVWASMPGVTRMSTSRPRRAAGGQPLEPVDLVEGVNHDPSHADFEGTAQLGVGLVVAVHDQTGARHAGGQGHVQLAASRHIDRHPLLVDQSGHGPAEESLGGVRHPAPHAATAWRHRRRRCSSS